MPNNIEHNNKDLTTTFGEKLISESMGKYGEDKVIENVVVVIP